MREVAINYRLALAADASQPGAHRGALTGSGYEFAHVTSLLRAPDPRRFDLRASLRDPFGALQVRVHRQRSRVPVYALADLSASMNFPAGAGKLAIVADFVDALRTSTRSAGDPLAFAGCDATMRDEWFVPLAVNHNDTGPLLRRLRRWQGNGDNCQGMVEAAHRVARQKGLVFVLSDFHWPATLIDTVLGALGRHQVVPVIIWHDAEHRLPNSGLARVRDLETGRQRTLLLRRGLASTVASAYRRRRAGLVQRFMRQGMRPLFVENEFDADNVNRYFFT